MKRRFTSMVLTTAALALTMYDSDNGWYSVRMAHLY